MAADSFVSTAYWHAQVKSRQRRTARVPINDRVSVCLGTWIGTQRMAWVSMARVPEFALANYSSICDFINPNVVVNHVERNMDDQTVNLEVSATFFPRDWFNALLGKEVTEQVFAVVDALGALHDGCSEEEE